MSLFALLGADADEELTHNPNTQTEEDAEDDLLNELQDALGEDAGVLPFSALCTPHKVPQKVGSSAGAQSLPATPQDAHVGQQGGGPSLPGTPAAGGGADDDDDEETDVDDIIEDTGTHQRPLPAIPMLEDDEMDAEGEGDGPGGAFGDDSGAQAEARALASIEHFKNRETRIVARFGTLQMERYESYRRSKIDKKNMKKLAVSVLGHALSDQVCTVLCSITKSYIGEVVETARILAYRGGHKGALMPIHIHEAYQYMKSKDRVPNSRQHSRLFR